MTLDLTDFQDLAKPVTFEILFHALRKQTTTVFIGTGELRHKNFGTNLEKFH